MYEKHIAQIQTLNNSVRRDDHRFEILEKQLTEHFLSRKTFVSLEDFHKRAKLQEMGYEFTTQIGHATKCMSYRASSQEIWSYYTTSYECLAEAWDHYIRSPQSKEIAKVPPHYEEQYDKNPSMNAYQLERERVQKLEKELKLATEQRDTARTERNQLVKTRSELQKKLERMEAQTAGHSETPVTQTVVQEATKPTYRLNLEELLTGDINRLHYVTRFSTALVQHRENVAEHSYYVMLYSVFLADWIRNNTTANVDIAHLLMRGLFHDLDECRTGDFIRSFKYSTPELKHALEEASALEMSKIINPVIEGGEKFKDQIMHYWEESKDDSVEGIIISFADYLSVVSHLWAEINSANNTIFQHYDSMIQYLGQLENSRYDIIRPLVQEVSHIVRHVLLAKDARKKYVPFCSDVPKGY